MEDETLLNKMMKEISEAKTNVDNKQTLLKHIGRIKLLCELIEEKMEKTESVQTSSSTESVFTEQEIKMMLGDRTVGLTREKQSSPIEHDGANGDSIFDF